MKAPAILVTYPSSFYTAGVEKVETKTPQLLLGSYLAQFYAVEYADFEISIGRPNTPVLIRRFERKVKEYLGGRNFDILALSCWTSLSFQATLSVARICRELYPKRLIVVGGYHASARPQDFVTKDQVVDFVICGEGEIAMRRVVEEYQKSGRPSATGVLNSPSVSEDEFVSYRWELAYDLYEKEFPEGLENVYLYLSRGCPFSCSFCMEPLKDHKWRAYSAERSMAEVKRSLELFHPAGLAIADACFGMRPGWRKDFLNKLAKLNPDCWIIIETRPEYLDEEDIRLLSGLKVEVQFGIESCSREILRLMKKARQPEKFLERFLKTSHLLSEYGVLHRANLIFNHPGETRRTLDETFGFIENELKKKGAYLIWGSHGYMHFPGCELDTNMQYYEERYGSRFLKPEWWKGTEEQSAASMEFVPSRDLEGDNCQLWEKMLSDRTEEMKAALSPKAFTFAAQKYFLDWRDDPRYGQS